MDITSATVTAFYLFEVAEHIDLTLLRTLIRGGETARLTSKSTAPSYMQYQTPPVVADGDMLGIGAIAGFRVRVKFFDYGVMSLALSRPFARSWQELVEISQEYIENDALERHAEGAARHVLARCAETMTKPHETFLSEDYLTLAVTGLAVPVTAEQLLAEHSRELALLLRGERAPLSRQEEEEVLRNRLSYLADDLVIPTWNGAFIYDTESGAAAALELFEFANSQLLEFRYYDDLLDTELGRIYATLQKTSWWNSVSGRGYIKAANQLHSLFIDVNEITDRTENALKFVGDIYAARVFSLVAARLGLVRWKQSVEDKLETLDDIYRFAVEQVGISRGQFLELTIIIILVFELVLFFLGIMK